MGQVDIEAGDGAPKRNDQMTLKNIKAMCRGT